MSEHTETPRTVATIRDDARRIMDGSYPVPDDHAHHAETYHLGILGRLFRELSAEYDRATGDSDRPARAVAATTPKHGRGETTARATSPTTVGPAALALLRTIAANDGAAWQAEPRGRRRIADVVYTPRTLARLVDIGLAAGEHTGAPGRADTLTVTAAGRAYLANLDGKPAPAAVEPPPAKLTDEPKRAAAGVDTRTVEPGTTLTTIPAALAAGAAAAAAVPLADAEVRNTRLGVTGDGRPTLDLQLAGDDDEALAAVQRLAELDGWTWERSDHSTYVEIRATAEIGGVAVDVWAHLWRRRCDDGRCVAVRATDDGVESEPRAELTADDLAAGWRWDTPALAAATAADAPPSGADSDEQ